jgi:hypothetical protein
VAGQFDRIEDGETVEGRNRFGAAESADSPEGYAVASGPDLATRCTPNEAAAAEKGVRLILRLNDGWRLAHDESLQWILQRRMSKPGKPAKWGGRRFHVERDPLLRSIRELCGPVDESAVETIRDWPRRYRPDFSAQPAVATLLPMAAE